jgi:hypothetical protein
MSLTRRAATGGISITRRDLDRAETLSFAWGVSPPLSDLNPQVKPPGERKTAMKNHNPLTNSIDPVRNSRNRSSGAGWTRAFLLLPFALVLASFALSPTARAVDPPPDGGYFGQNTAEGEDALFSLSCCASGYDNTAIGFKALFTSIAGSGNTAVGSQALFSNQEGSENTAIGYQALYSNTAFYNTAIGWGALFANTVGVSNTGSGRQALVNNTSGSYNTASGDEALFWNTTGSYNTAHGYFALNGDASLRESTGSSNTATGAFALQNISTGSFNTASGANALYSNTTGISNTAHGAFALQNNTIGFNNTANGVNALVSNTTGNENTANGNSALSLNTTGLHNTADGSQALLRNTTGNSNIALGFQAGQNLTIGSSNIDIGNAGVAGDSRKIRIGIPGTQNGAFVAGIYGVTVSRGIGVIVDSTGHLGTTTSSARFKEAIKPMDKTSEAIHELKPVTFRYRHELDPEGIPQFGLVAEQVEKVNPDLVARDEEGKPYTVRYEAVNAMLLNEFLKEHRKVESLEKEMKALSTALQKVSNELELMKAAPRVVANDQ